MDIIEIFPEEISDLIFTHFSGSELLELTLVNPNWNNFVGSSLRSMKKLVLGLRGDWNDFTEENIEPLFSDRKYQNVLISDVSKNFDGPLKILRSRQRWKSVRILDVAAPTQLDITHMFETFDSTVEHLDLFNLTLKRNKHFKMVWNFPKLKFLKVSFGIRKNSYFDMPYCVYEENNAMTRRAYSTYLTPMNIERFNQMANLKKLHVSPEFFLHIQSEELKPFSFHLEELTIFGNMSQCPSIDGFLVNFLKANSHTLRKLSLNDLLGIGAMKMAFELEMLKKLTFTNIRHINKIELEMINFVPSSSIEELDIITNRCLERRDLTIKMLKAVPKLKKLHILTVHKSVAKFIAKNLKNLREIEVIYGPEDPSVRKILYNVDVSNSYPCE